jgi:hypothetical protein
MAELVGDAYIRITADTEQMRRALASQMKRAGKDAGHAFSDEVQRVSKAEAKRAQTQFAKGIVDPKEFDKMAKGFDKVEDAAKSFNEKLTELRKSGHIAKGETVLYRKAIKDWEKQAIATRNAAKKLNDEHFEAIVINKKLTAAQKEQSRQLRILYERDHGEALRILREESALRKMVLNRDHAEALAMQAKWRRDAERMRKEAEAAQKKENERQILVEKDHQKYLRDVRQRSLTNYFNDQISTLNAVNKAREKAEKEAERRMLARRRENDRKRGIRRDIDGRIIGRASALGRELDKIDYRMGRWSDKVGKMFGRGSRNNFINLIGAAARGVFRLGTRLLAVPLGVFGALTDGIAAFAQTWKRTGNIFKAAGSGVFAFGKGMVSLIPAIIAAVGGLFLFGKVIPGVVSGLSLLAGAVVATASAISYGLVGALLAVGPAAAGALLGLGGVFLAIQQFASDKKNKKLMKEWFSDPQKNWAKQFKEQAKSFLSDMHEVLHVVLDAATPAVKAFFTSWDKNMKDASTKKSGQAIVDSLSRIATTLNTAIPHALSGLIGFFEPIMPYAEKLATWLGSLATRFDTWANSAKGKNSIADFMETAWADAHRVWQILVDIKDLIFTVFEQGEPTGAGILDGIHSKLREMIDWLQDPANKGKIEEWFANAGQMAVDVGVLAGHIADIIRNFNSPEGQKNAKGIMDTINAIGAAAATVSATADAVGSIFDWLEKIVNFGSPEGANGHGWLHNLIWGEDKPLPKAPEFKPQTIPTKTPAETLTGRKAAVETYRIANISPTAKLATEQLKAINDYKFSDKTIPIKGNEELWAIMRDSAAAYVFTEKQIPVEGNMAEWDKAKGTAAGYVFDTKTIAVKMNTENLSSAIANVKRWLATIPAVKRVGIRIAGVTGTGGIPIGAAAGGYFDSPTVRTIGEAGPEAVVPLDRDLSRVDPAVREMSRVLQGMTGGRGGSQSLGTGPKVNFEAGAFAVNLPTGDPQLAAEAVLDRLVAYI